MKPPNLLPDWKLRLAGWLRHSHLVSASILLQGADWLTTAASLANGGYETNPFMAWIIAHYGVIGHGIYKAGMGAFILGFGVIGRRHIPHLTRAILGLYLLPLAYVVVCNIAVIARAKGLYP
ncbi:MAG: DUF5658 family protein [Rhodanobacter sp.]